VRSQVRAIAQTRAAPKAHDGRITQRSTPLQTPSPFAKPLEYPAGAKFADMTGTQKCVFSAKLDACIATFGFAFPNDQHD
jgi:hypothetical protein